MDALPMTTELAALGPDLTREQAREIYTQGEEATIFALLQLAKMVAQHARPPGPAPSTPSGMIPPYQKPTTPEGKGSRACKKPGARPGHAGKRRPKPERIDHFKTHTLENCPDCGGSVARCRD